MLHLCTVNTSLFEVYFSHSDEMSYSRSVSQFSEISSNTVTCKVTGKRVNRGGGCEMAKSVDALQKKER